MKTKFYCLLIFSFILSISAQGLPPKHNRAPKERLEQLEKIKLLEILDLGEEKSVRFFSRRDDFKETHQEILDERDAIILEMEIALKKDKTSEEFNYSEKLSELADIEQKIVDHRETFIQSLSDILTSSQIAKVVVFESKFMKEVRNALMHRRGRK